MSKTTTWLGKIAPKLVSLLVVSMLIIGAIFWNSFNNAADEYLLHESELNINRLNILFNTVIEKETEMLCVAVDMITNKKGLTDRFLNDERLSYVDHAQTTFNNLKNDHNITHYSVHNLNETCFVRMHEPDYYGDLITRDTLHQARDTMDEGIGIETCCDSLKLRVVKPLFNGTQHIGYVELGVEIKNILLDTVDLMDEEIMLTLNKNFLDQEEWEQLKNNSGERNNWDDMGSNVIVYSTMSQPENHIDISFSNDDLILSNENTIINLKYSYNNTSYSSGRVPIYNVSGQIMGSLILIDDITEHTESHALEFQQTMLLIVIMLLVILLIISVSIHLWVSRPISEIIDKTRRFGKGDMDVQIDTKMKGEVGELAHAFDNMTSELKEYKEGLEDTIAQRTQELNTKVDELERYKKLTVDRELRMVELKKEIDKLKTARTGEMSQ